MPSRSCQVADPFDPLITWLRPSVRLTHGSHVFSDSKSVPKARHCEPPAPQLASEHDKRSCDFKQTTYPPPASCHAHSPGGIERVRVFLPQMAGGSASALSPSRP